MRIKQLLFVALVFLLCTTLDISLYGQSTCAPVLTYDNNYNLCSNSGVLNLTVSVGIPNGCAYANTVTPYQWQGPGTPGATDDNQISITNPVYGDYFVEVVIIQSPLAGSPTCPCIGVHTSNIVSVNPLPPLPNVTSDTITCGGITTVSATAPTGGASGGYFNWYDLNDNLLFSGGTFTTPPLNTTTSYKVSYVTNGCESNKRTFSVIVNPLPQPLVSNDTISCNNATTLFASSPSGSSIYWYANANATNLVYIGSQFTTPPLVTTTTYYAVSTNGTCQSSPKPVSVEVQTTPTPLVSTVRICQGEEITLTAQHGSGTSGSGTFEWYTSNNLFLHSGTQFTLTSSMTSNPGTVLLYVLENNRGCKSGLVAQTIEVLPQPSVSATSSFVKVCEHTSLELSALSPNDPNVTYYWETPWDTILEGQSQTFSQATRGTFDGKFYVYVENGFGCASAVDQVVVQVVPAPNLGLMPYYEVVDGESIDILASGADWYSWSPSKYFDDSSSSNPQFTAPSLNEGQPDTVIVVVEGRDLDNTCSAIDTTLIIVQPFVENGSNAPIQVYEVITPNGDGYNDVWYIDYLYNLPEYSISLFDNRNRLIYHFKGEGTAYNNSPWDGKVFDKDEPAPTGTYRYTIEYPGMSKPVSGYLTVLSK